MLDLKIHKPASSIMCAGSIVVTSRNMYKDNSYCEGEETFPHLLKLCLINKDLMQ